MKTNAVNCSVNDYDFYTIPLPVKTLLHRQKDRYIGSQLEKLHPCFSDDCSFDSHLRLGKKGLNADVVVMQKYKVAEYKALYKRMFVQERKHIQFFAGNKRMRRCVVAVVGLLMFVFALVFFHTENLAQKQAETNKENEPMPTAALPDSQNLFVPELLLQIKNLHGTVSDFLWNYDGYNESSAVLVKGIYPEQLEVFSNILKFSSVSFEDFNPCFSTSFSTKVLQHQTFEKQNLVNFKNDFRQIFLQNDIVILEEVVKPFGIKFLVTQNESKKIAAVFEYLKKYNICISSIKINSSDNYLKMELVFSETVYKTPEALYDFVIYNIEVFAVTQKSAEINTAAVNNSGTKKSEVNFQKVGQITKPDGSIVTYYKDENGKIITR